jgi:hypothetical protein
MLISGQLLINLVHLTDKVFSRVKVLTVAVTTFLMLCGLALKSLCH